MKNKAATDGGERPSSTPWRPLFAQDDDDEVFVTGSTLYAREVNPPDTNPLVITPFSAAVGQNLAGIFVEN